jgi:methylphosphotriester-DNA--protein-cysteine methyltransferase
MGILTDDHGAVAGTHHHATACRSAARPEFLATAFDRMIDRSAHPGADPVLLSMHGFSNIKQMRVDFLQHLGMTPSQYRQVRHWDMENRFAIIRMLDPLNSS